jgi:hypothetical protein
MIKEFTWIQKGKHWGMSDAVYDFPTTETSEFAWKGW